MDWMIPLALHWGLALIPVLILLGVFTWLDAFELMSVRELTILIILGGFAALVAYPVSGRMLDALPIGFSFYSRYLAPWIEEALKGVIIIVLFRMNRIGYKLDAVLSGFAIGAGFSVVENILYLMTFPDYGMGTWLVRGLGTAVMHGTTTALFAAIAHEFAERENREAKADFDFGAWWFFPGYFVAVALHILFNQFPEQPMLAMMGALVISPITLMAVFHFGQAEASEWLEQEYADHKVQLAALDKGAWPDSESGRRIAALAERLGPDRGAQVRDYFRTLAYLVVEAEETMIEESTGDAVFDSGKVASAFATLDRLRAAMGKTTFRTLDDMLPFSRNDLWEVSELRQRIGKLKTR
jgi:RsiW-degrading membrane proteinase PrsW (M82 family)